MKSLILFFVLGLSLNAFSNQLVVCSKDVGYGEKAIVLVTLKDVGPERIISSMHYQTGQKLVWLASSSYEGHLGVEKNTKNSQVYKVKKNHSEAALEVFEDGTGNFRLKRTLRSTIEVMNLNCRVK